MDEKAAWDMINFLRPNGKFPAYYNQAGADWRGIQVHGSVSLCELTSLSFTSLHLGNFAPPA